MKKICISICLIISSVLFISCSNENSAIKIEEDSKITIDVNKAVDNVDTFFEGVADNLSDPTKENN